MRWLLAILLLTPAMAFELDGFCDRAGGESCMNSQDCKVCNISLSLEASYTDLYATVTLRLTSYEPDEVPLAVEVGLDGKQFTGFTKDLKGEWVKELRVPRGKGNQTLVVDVKDRDIGAVWAHGELDIRGIARQGKLDFLAPLAAILAFFGILYYGIKLLRQPRYFFVPPPPPAPRPRPEEEIVVVRKKKKYYYRK